MKNKPIKDESKVSNETKTTNCAESIIIIEYVNLMCILNNTL